MKHAGVCTKCGSSDVVKIPGKSPGHNWLPVGLGTVAVDRWVCCSCGYSEEWIEQDKLQNVKKWWQESQ